MALNINLLDSYKDTLGINVVLQMLDLYIQQSEIYLQDIENAINLDEQAAWQKSCHKMKGAAASVGLLRVHEKIVLIEKSLDVQEQKKTFLAELKLLNQLGIESIKNWLE